MSINLFILKQNGNNLIKTTNTLVDSLRNDHDDNESVFYR